MIITAILLLQAGAPDIQLHARVRARSVTIQQKGEARLAVTTSPDGGNLVDVQAPRANGRRELRNVDARVRAEARIADPGQARNNNLDQPETAPPQ
jgi:hypothetical protein